MDSREIYNVATRLNSMMNWDKDWVHYGTWPELNMEMVENIITNYLQDEKLFFIEGRKNSGQFERKYILEIIKPLLGAENFQLWSLSMTRVIQFNRIGVLNLGIRE